MKVPHELTHVSTYPSDVEVEFLLTGLAGLTGDDEYRLKKADRHQSTRPIHPQPTGDKQ